MGCWCHSIIDASYCSDQLWNYVQAYLPFISIDPNHHSFSCVIRIEFASEEVNNSFQLGFI